MIKMYKWNPISTIPNEDQKYDGRMIIINDPKVMMVYNCIGCVQNIEI